MIAVWIICGILALLMLAALIKLTVRVEYCGGLYVTVGIGFLRFTKDVERGRNPQQPQEQATPAEESQEEKKEKTEIALKELIPLARETVSGVLEKAKKHVKLERYLLKINVATGDPASTGVLYGAVCAAAGSLLALALSARRKSRKKGAIYTEITPDFISDKPDIKLDIKLSTRVWRGLSISIPLIKGYRNYRKLKKKKEKENERHPAQTDN